MNDPYRMPGASTNILSFIPSRGSARNLRRRQHANQPARRHGRPESSGSERSDYGYHHAVQHWGRGRFV